MAETTDTPEAPAAAGIRCDTTIQRIRDRTIVRLPDEASAKLPSRGQVSVKGTINGHAFRTVLEPDGGRGHWLEITGQLAKNLTINEGDTIALEMWPTEDWPEPDLPKDFGATLTDASDISELWNGITPMARWEWVRWINATKNPETRTRRIEVTISKLRAGKRRPCCFDLSACTDADLSKSGKLVGST